jgi:uroporphyrin-III C-methyltransferase
MSGEIRERKSMRRGKVFIVGAGPGKKEFLTLRALEVIKEADVIIHDALIGEVKEILKEVRAEIIDAGKRSGKHRMTQQEINDLLLKYAQEGKKVVRLKGGDPFVFGRGGEEAEFLASHGIEFEVVPGITSAIAVPASAGIPVTHRRYDPALVFITGRESRERMNWKALAELNATIVVLMGAGRVKEVCENLLRYGKNPQTPVAIIEKGYSDDERILVCDLQNAGELSEKEVVSSPAIIVIGDVVRLRERLKEYLKSF